MTGPEVYADAKARALELLDEKETVEALCLISWGLARGLGLSYEAIGERLQTLAARPERDVVERVRRWIGGLE